MHKPAQRQPAGFIAPVLATLVAAAVLSACGGMEEPPKGPPVGLELEKIGGYAHSGGTSATVILMRICWKPQTAQHTTKRVMAKASRCSLRCGVKGMVAPTLREGKRHVGGLTVDQTGQSLASKPRRRAGRRVRVCTRSRGRAFRG